MSEQFTSDLENPYESPKTKSDYIPDYYIGDILIAIILLPIVLIEICGVLLIIALSFLWPLIFLSFFINKETQYYLILIGFVLFIVNLLVLIVSYKVIKNGKKSTN